MVIYAASDGAGVMHIIHPNMIDQRVPLLLGQKAVVVSQICIQTIIIELPVSLYSHSEQPQLASPD
jgi:hypothetical protein